MFICHRNITLKKIINWFKPNNHILSTCLLSRHLFLYIIFKKVKPNDLISSKDLFSGNQTNDSCYTSRRNSTTSNTNSEPQDVAPHLVKFVRDSSKYWYKPNITRDEAIALLRNAPPGTFIVRDSKTFANAFGLVIKVAMPPPSVTQRSPMGDELVRHFLVEPTTRGVRFKGCANEPVFTSLSALVYQHSITPLALPCKLIIPDRVCFNFLWKIRWAFFLNSFVLVFGYRIWFQRNIIHQPKNSYWIWVHRVMFCICLRATRSHWRDHKRSVKR